MMDRVPGQLSDADISTIFAETQAAREKGAKRALDISHRSQNIECLQPPAGPIMSYLIPYLSRDFRMERGSAPIIGAVKIDKLPVKPKPHFIPFIHELPAKPLKRTVIPRLVAALGFLGLYYIGASALRPPKGFPSSWSFLGTPFKTEYVGNAGVDGLLTILVKFFSSSITSEDPAPLLQAIYLAATLIPTLLIWTIESRRRGNIESMIGRLVTWYVTTPVHPIQPC